MTVIIKNIKAPIRNTEKEALSVTDKLIASKGFSGRAISVCKKSVDARNRSNICYVCSVIAELDGDPSENELALLGATEKKESRQSFEHGEKPLSYRPLVVGFGPCGMFLALALAEEGYRPIVIERGGSVENRVSAVEQFYKTGVLDEDTNIQFGAGGAGAFSDGKLVTRINDQRCSYVLERLVEFGAPSEILINAKPHIGTDLLRRVISSIAERIEALGGDIMYNTTLVSLERCGEGFLVKTTQGEIDAGIVALAIGHSARDTYSLLEKKGFLITPKSFSVGLRVEHLADDINAAMYGRARDILPPAEYQLSKRKGERGAYTFCMCPGGEVVAAASERGGVVVNGMSQHARDGKNSNSAVAVTVLPSDYGATPSGAIAFQRSLEKMAFSLGGGDYSAPCSTLGDFLRGESGTKFTRVKPTYMNGRVKMADLSSILPSFVTEMLRIGFADFGKKIKGFDAPFALLTGVETRTSAPIRIERGEDMCAVGFEGIYPCGEGAGYAGGITSAAVDGIRCAEAIISKYKEF